MSDITRRSFLKTAGAAAGGVVTAPCVIAGTVLGANGGVAASERVTMGIIGCGIMGERHRRNFSTMPQSEVVAVCDVNSGFREAIKARSKPGVKLYDDFRDLLARDDIDAVAISTPHHSHAWITVAAAEAGKDIYCEKPLTRWPHENKVVVDAVRRYGRILEVGTHRRAGVAQRFSAELVRNERIGKLHTMRVYGRPGTTTEPCPVWEPRPVPKGFNWDMWVGPAPWIDFCGVHERRLWNRYSDYSVGEITMTDCHIIDGALWAAEPFLKGPIDIEGQWKPEPHIEYRVTFKYASGVTMICEARSDMQPLSAGTRFEGTDGWVHNDLLRYTFRTHPASLQHATIGPDEVHLPSVRRLHNEWRGVSEDFLYAVRTREEPLCPVEGGARMSIISQLIWIACKLRRKLKWDWDNDRFIDDDDANKFVFRAYREPWRL